MIKHIFFDIDDTLYPSRDFATLARKNAIKAMIRAGLNVKEEELEKLLYRQIKEKGSNYEHHFDDLLKELRVKKRERYVAAAVAAYHDTKITILPYPEVPRVLLELRDKKIKLYIASEGISIKQWDKLLRLGIAQYFEEVFVVNEKKGGKNTKFYKEIIKKIKAKPEECLMVGDKEEKDIVPAKKAGMLTFRIMRGNIEKTAADFSGKDLKKILEIVKKPSK
ncbi:MAG: TIGR02253 family HAD-type hydrolase [Candidatus Bilamarchaeaceae archaeon]